MPKKPTIYDIKYHTSEKSPYFFDRKSMKHFGQTLRDFSVFTSPTGRIFLFARMLCEGKFTGSYTVREYNEKEGTLELLPHEAGRTLPEIFAYFKAN